MLHHQHKKKRFTIGFLSANVAFDVESLLFQGMRQAAEKYGVNLVYISQLENENLDSFKHLSDLHGMRLENNLNKSDNRLQASSKYDKLQTIVKNFAIDGLIFIGWSKDAEDSNIHLLQQAFENIPIISVGKDIDNITSVYTHGSQYISELTKHLIEEHLCRNIALIAPRKFDKRIDRFIDTMQAYQIYDQNIVIDKEIEGINDSVMRINAAFNILFNERQADIDAVIVMTASEGKYALEYLQDRGIRVPEDIKLVCYEDHPSIAYSSPSLTTIDYPFEKLGYSSGETLVRLLNEGKAPLLTEIPTKIVYRDSCGCSINSAPRFEYDTVFYNSENASVVDLAAHLSSLFPSLNINFDKVINTFLADIKEEKTDAFLPILQDELKRHNHEYRETTLQEFINALKEATFPYYSDNELYNIRAEKIWFAAKYIVKDFSNHQTILDFISTDKINKVLKAINQSFMSAYSLPKIIHVMENAMTWLKIPSCFLHLSKNEQLHDDSLVFSYYDDETKNISEKQVADVFAHFVNRKREERFDLVVMLHSLNQSETALIVMEPGENQTNTLISYWVQIIAALKGAFLMDESQELIKKLAYYADTDPLTKLFNRRFFYRSLKSAIKKEQPFSIFYIDVDGFKPVNDMYGHAAGDDLLQQIAGRITFILGKTSYPLEHELLYGNAKANAIFRLGGDEFTVLFNSTDPIEIEAYVKKLIRFIELPYSINGQHKSVISCSVGISSFPADSNDLESLLKKADTALYCAKKLKNTFQIYSSIN
ncbi:GGDEF domain-containing protein [Evansella cellulosilytica]|uniref:Diguanylate cyclase n=1 Tax=Evansella cellulosilytica (strain ATCC 21833 / DSM 2522 / FERM P-1141 / JCM 9156 / N-4) TaxID=649639 RepID=E6TTJ5_EVAC2|nr:GGDEF domain-containing protein [Evansella cellulosilytica]ADU29631.1 diguanylate cyclase [Evansella cellulosilytica DSM 2522]